jgi:hypothetical protein
MKVKNIYKREVVSPIDIYDILNAYGVQSHAVGDAIKKLLVAGQRGAKSYSQDIIEARASIDREIEDIEALNKESTDEIKDVRSLPDDAGFVDYSGVKSLKFLFVLNKHKEKNESVLRWVFEAKKIAQKLNANQKKYLSKKIISKIIEAKLNEIGVVGVSGKPIKAATIMREFLYYYDVKKA